MFDGRAPSDLAVLLLDLWGATLGDERPQFAEERRETGENSQEFNRVTSFNGGEETQRELGSGDLPFSRNKRHTSVGSQLL